MSSRSGLYPLHLAVRKGGERCLRVLVGAGAQINMPEQKSGCTALHMAVKENLFKVACTIITEVNDLSYLKHFLCMDTVQIRIDPDTPGLICLLSVAAEGRCKLLHIWRKQSTSPGRQYRFSTPLLSAHSSR